MSEKISITIDLTKINKNKIVERKYTNKDGQEITEKEYKIDVIPTNSPSIIKEEPTYTMIKKYFVAEAPTREEREQKVKTPILGDGIVFEQHDNKMIDEVLKKIGSIEISSDDVPF
jgi:hypothetical protein